MTLALLDPVSPGDGGPVAFACRSDRWRPWLLPVAAAGHLALVALRPRRRDPSRAPGWTAGCCSIRSARSSSASVSVLFFLCSLYAPGYLALRSDRPNRVFCASLLALPGDDDAGHRLSHHLGLMWVAMEATTLASAPLLYFNHNARSLEATWKYLLIGSVGIALALLGSFFLAYCVAARRAANRLAAVRRPRPQRAAASRRPGCTRPSCCCSSATAPRWAWPRCTPGSPTPTAKRRASWARCSPAASPAAPSSRSCASTRSAAAGEEASSPARS